MSTPRPVKLYFDFISPYSYLASRLIAGDERLSRIDFQYRPVVFGSLLSALGVRGQGEIPARRRIGMQDVLLLAYRHGIPLEGPPTHPFNSIYALRSVCAVEDEQTRGELMRRYFLESWGNGRSLEDLDLLRECLETLGIDQDPEEAATMREHRVALKRNTKELLDAGGWGVPTFIVDDLLFFGHDRLWLLADYLDGLVDPHRDKLEDLLARPRPGRIT